MPVTVTQISDPTRKQQVLSDFQVANNEWQQSLGNIKDQFIFVYKRSLWTDCIFEVGKTKQIFKCHRLLLAKSSPVFATMLYTKHFNNEDVIYIPDTTPEAFDALVNYMYTDQIETLPTKTVLALMQLAKKYLMPDSLLTTLRTLMQESLLQFCRVWLTIFVGRRLDEPELITFSWHYVLMNTSEVLSHENFVNAMPEDLLILVQQNSMRINGEHELFSAYVRWAVHQLQQDYSPSETNQDSTISIQMVCEKLYPYMHHIYISSIIPSRLNEMEFKILKQFKKYSNTTSDSKMKRERMIDSFFVNGMKELPTTSDWSKFQYNSKAQGIVNHKNHLLGVQIATQLQPVECKSDFYNEDLTIIVYDECEEKIISKTRYQAITPYEKIINVPFIKPTNNSSVSEIRVVFHKSGIYPTRYERNDHHNGELVKYDEFGDVVAKFYTNESYYYIQFMIEEMEEEASDNDEDDLYNMIF